MKKNYRDRMARADQKTSAEPQTLPQAPVTPDVVAELNALKPGDVLVLRPGDKIESIPRKPVCPYCGRRESTVERTVGETRYRRCSGCGRNFSTIEIVKK